MTAAPLKLDLIRGVRPALLTLLGAVACVLLIACANLANLLLARGTARAGELAVRSALGASRGRIVRQLLTESAVLGLAGALLGLALAHWGLDVLVALLPAGSPRADAIAVDGRVLAFTVALALATSLGFGIVPALAGSRADVHGALKSVRTSTVGRGRTRTALLLAEIAVSFVLLVAGGLALRSFARVAAVDPGFDPRDLLTGAIALPETRYRTDAQMRTFYDQLLARVQALPGVQGAALVLPVPYSPSNVNLVFSLPGRAPPPGGHRVPTRFVSPDYFAVMGIDLQRGRTLKPSDDHEGGPPVAVVSESFARTYFPGQDRRWSAPCRTTGGSGRSWAWFATSSRAWMHPAVPRPISRFPAPAWTSRSRLARWWCDHRLRWRSWRRSGPSCRRWTAAFPSPRSPPWKACCTDRWPSAG